MEISWKAKPAGKIDSTNSQFNKVVYHLKNYGDVTFKIILLFDTEVFQAQFVQNSDEEQTHFFVKTNGKKNLHLFFFFLHQAVKKTSARTGLRYLRLEIDKPF
jgi:hypothetical protein